MSNPLTHVGQTARPEDSPELQQHCQQAQAQQQAGQQQTQTQTQSPGSASTVDSGQQMGGSGSERSPTRIPQHPQQQQESTAQGSIGRERIRQQGETRAEDTSLPSPTDAD